MEGKSITIIILSIVLVGVIVAGVFLLIDNNSKIDDLELQLSSTEEELDQRSGELETANLEIESAEATNEKLTSDIADLTNQISITENNLEELTLAHYTLQTEYTTLDTTYQEVCQDLADIQELYPLKDFSSRGALQDWIDDNLQPTEYSEDGMFRAACKMVELGMEEGYWIGIDMNYDESSYEYYSWCCAFVNDKLYLFMPDFEDTLIETEFFR